MPSLAFISRNPDLQLSASPSPRVSPSPELRDLHLAAECCLLRAALFHAERRIAELASSLTFGVSCVNSMGASIKRMKAETIELKQENARLLAALHRAYERDGALRR